jgi:hypothetical protein
VEYWFLLTLYLRLTLTLITYSPFLSRLVAATMTVRSNLYQNRKLALKYRIHTVRVQETVISFAENLSPIVLLSWCPWGLWFNTLPWTSVGTVVGYGCRLCPFRLSNSAPCLCQDVRLLSGLDSKSLAMRPSLPGALEVTQHFPGCPSVYKAFSSSLTVTHGRILNFAVLAHFPSRLLHGLIYCATV